MGNQNQGGDRQTQGGAGQKTNPQDPTITPERDDENQIERRTSDEGQGRNQASTKRSSGSESDADDKGTTDQGGRSKSGATDQGQTGTNRGGNP